jgi:hypothetical protein
MWNSSYGRHMSKAGYKYYLTTLAKDDFTIHNKLTKQGGKWY